MPRASNPPHPTRHSDVCRQICQRVGQDGKTLTLVKSEGLPMTFSQAHAFKQQFLRFRASLDNSVRKGEAKWEALLAQADLVAVSIRRLPDGRGSISFYNRERTQFARTVAEALAQSELA